MTTDIKKRQQLADCFKLMAVFFYEPELAMWEQEEILFRFVELINKTVPDAFPAAKRMREAAETFDEEQMKVDYAALFVGPFELHAAPYGSVYLEKNKRIMGDSTMAVINIYRQAGLKVDIQEPPDHIAIELEFMHYLYCQEADAVHDGDREKEISTVNLRAHFLTTCLGPWVHQFCRSIRIGTNNLFYTDLAQCLEILVAQVSGSDTIPLTENSLIPQKNVIPSSV